MFYFLSTLRKPRRRGAVSVLAALMVIVLAACLALAIDVGYLCLVRTQAQVAADASALAAGQSILTEDRLRGYFQRVYDSAQSVAAQYAGLHRLGPANANLQVDEDVIIGRLDDPTDLRATLDTSYPATYNALAVIVRASEERARQCPLFFARVFGIDGRDVQATATVAYADRIVGFRTSSRNPTTSLLPFSAKVESWRDLLKNGLEDNWTYNPKDRTVAAGPDGIPELKLFPIDTGAAGNWGTVDIGCDNNSTADLRRQIRDGVNADDLAEYGGVLTLDKTTGSLTLNGDTGISAGMKDAMVDIVGKGRTILLHRSVEGPGNNANYEVVGFAGIRVVDVKMTGNQKYILLQPAYVIDPTAAFATWSSESYFVTQPLRLVR